MASKTANIPAQDRAYFANDVDNITYNFVKNRHGGYDDVVDDRGVIVENFLREDRTKLYDELLKLKTRLVKTKIPAKEIVDLFNKKPNKTILFDVLRRAIGETTSAFLKEGSPKLNKTRVGEDAVHYNITYTELAAFVKRYAAFSTVLNMEKNLYSINTQEYVYRGMYTPYNVERHCCNTTYSVFFHYSKL